MLWIMTSLSELTLDRYIKKRGSEEQIKEYTFKIEDEIVFKKAERYFQSIGVNMDDAINSFLKSYIEVMEKEEDISWIIRGR